jgi:hypothetical protein
MVSKNRVMTTSVNSHRHESASPTAALVTAQRTVYANKASFNSKNYEVRPAGHIIPAYGGKELKLSPFTTRIFADIAAVARPRTDRDRNRQMEIKGSAARIFTLDGRSEHVEGYCVSGKPRDVQILFPFTALA